MKKKKVLLILVCFPSHKKGRSSYDVTMTHDDAILMLFFFIFVANLQDLTMNRRGVIMIYLPQAKMSPPGAYTGIK